MSPDNPFRVVRRTDPNAAATHDPGAALARLSARKLPKALGGHQETAPLYRLSEELETAINMALAVAAPLLLTGEPGTGKTQVGWYLGWYFGVEVLEFPVKSHTTAQDLKYEFDAVAYLRTAREGAAQASRGEFLHRGPLWRAYLSERPVVLLIDEIDKAPRDFPNDLLQELDQRRFAHPLPEHRPRWVKPVAGPPLVVITSNVERRLPDAFLRRCIFHHIDLTPELVRDAVGAHFPELPEPLRHAALERFWKLHGLPQVQKKPGTAELLAWLAILVARQVAPGELEMTRSHRGLPAITALLKDADDLKRLEQL